MSIHIESNNFIHLLLHVNLACKNDQIILYLN